MPLSSYLAYAYPETLDGKALPDNVVDELKKQEAEYAAKEAEIERMVCGNRTCLCNLFS